MATSEHIPELPFKSRIFAAATGRVATPCLPVLAIPEALIPHLDRWIAADLATKGVIDITGSLSWWKATLRQLDAELVLPNDHDEADSS